MKVYDTIVIGGGQAGLSMGYFLRRQKLDYLILDDNHDSGGSWLQTWDNLKLFSPVQFSSMSGWMMPKGEGEYPTKNEFLDYMSRYEQRYAFPIKRPVDVKHVRKEGGIFILETDKEVFRTKTIVSATGSAQNPLIPSYPGQSTYEGTQFHSVNYKNADDLSDKRVLIIGGGNSGAQLLAEVSKVAKTQWVTLEEPYFLPDHIDGRYLFDAATNKYLGKQGNSAYEIKASLSNIVMVDSVKEAQERGVLHAKRPFKSFYNEGVVWENGISEPFDVVIWCTGFKPNLAHLQGLGIVEDYRIKTNGTRSTLEPRLWLLGYGNWTGFASATIYGVGKTARQTAREIVDELGT